MGSLHEFRSGREHSSFVPPLASLAVYASLVLVRGDNLRDSLAPEDFSGRPAGLQGCGGEILHVQVLPEQ